MHSFSFITLFFVASVAGIAAIVLTSLLARLRPGCIPSLHWLGFLMILAAGGQSILLLVSDTTGNSSPALSGMVLALTTGLGLYLESARQHTNQITSGKS